MMKVWNNYMQAELNAIAWYYDNEGQLHAIYDESALKRLAKMLNNRIKNHKQNVVMISGPTGSGKSTLGIGLCRYMDPKWSLEENYVYSLSDIRRSLRAKPTDRITLFDEAAISLNSLDYAKKDNKIMAGMFDTMRSLRWTSVLIAPSEREISSRVRDIHADYMLKCPADPPIPGYSATGFCKIYKHKFRDFGDPYYQLIATCIFPPMQPGIAEQYEAIKRRHQDAYLEAFLKDDDAE